MYMRIWGTEQERTRVQKIRGDLQVLPPLSYAPLSVTLLASTNNNGDEA